MRAKDAAVSVGKAVLQVAVIPVSVEKAVMPVSVGKAVIPVSVGKAVIAVSVEKAVIPEARESWEARTYGTPTLHIHTKVTNFLNDPCWRGNPFTSSKVKSYMQDFTSHI